MRGHPVSQSMRYLKWSHPRSKREDNSRAQASFILTHLTPHALKRYSKDGNNIVYCNSGCDARAPHSFPGLFLAAIGRRDYRPRGVSS